MAKFQIHHDVARDKMVFSGEIRMLEIAELRFSDFDLLVLDDDVDCAADMLLKLEMIYRLLENRAPIDGSKEDVARLVHLDADIATNSE